MWHRGTGRAALALLLIAFLAWRFAGDAIDDFWRWKFTRVASPSPPFAVADELTDIDVTDQPASEVIAALEKRHGIKIECAPVPGDDPFADTSRLLLIKITCRMSQVKLGTALETLAALLYGDGVVNVDAGKVRLSPRMLQAAVHSTRLHPLDRWLTSPHEISEEQLAEAVRVVLRAEASQVSVVPGGLVVTAFPDGHAAIDRLIEALSQPDDSSKRSVAIWPLPHPGDAAVEAALDEPLGVNAMSWQQAALEIARRGRLPLAMEDTNTIALSDELTPRLSLRGLGDVQFGRRRPNPVARHGSLVIHGEAMQDGMETWRLYPLHDLLRPPVQLPRWEANFGEVTRCLESVPQSHRIQGWWLVEATDQEHERLEDFLSRLRETLLGVDPAKSRRLLAYDRIAAALETPLTVDWQEVPLREALEELGRRIDVPVWLETALEPLRASLSCRDEPASSVLLRLLDPWSSTFDIRGGVLVVESGSGRRFHLHVVRMPFGGEPFLPAVTALAPNVYAVAGDHRSYVRLKQHIATQARSLQGGGDDSWEPVDSGRSTTPFLKRRIRLYPVPDLTRDRWPARTQELAAVARQCAQYGRSTAGDSVRGDPGLLRVDGPTHLQDVTQRLLATLRAAKHDESAGPWTMEIAPVGEQQSRKLVAKALGVPNADGFHVLRDLNDEVPVGSLGPFERWLQPLGQAFVADAEPATRTFDGLLAALLLKPLYRENLVWLADADAPDEVPVVRIHEVPELFAAFEQLCTRQGAAREMRVVASYLSGGSREGSLVDDFCHVVQEWLTGGTVARFDRWLFAVGPPAFQDRVDELLAELQPLVHGLPDDPPQGDGFFVRGYSVSRSPQDWLQEELLEVVRRMLDPRHGDDAPFGYRPPSLKPGIGDIYDLWLVRDTAANHARIRRLIKLLASEHPLALRKGPPKESRIDPDDPFPDPAGGDPRAQWICDLLSRNQDELVRDFGESLMLARTQSRSAVVVDYLAEQLVQCQPDRNAHERQRTYRLCRALAMPANPTTHAERVVERLSAWLETERDPSQRGCYLRLAAEGATEPTTTPNPDPFFSPTQLPSAPLGTAGDPLVERIIAAADPADLVRLSPFLTWNQRSGLRPSLKAVVLRHVRRDQPYVASVLLAQYGITGVDLSAVAAAWEQSPDAELRKRASDLRLLFSDNKVSR